MSAQSKKELMKQTRERRKNAGLVRCEVYVKPEKKGELEDFVVSELGGEYTAR